jgi:hypothetical protein
MFAMTDLFSFVSIHLPKRLVDATPHGHHGAHPDFFTREIVSANNKTCLNVNMCLGNFAPLFFNIL